MLKVMSRKCGECLFTARRIVTIDRMRDILATCAQKDHYFVCHQSPKQEEIVCKGFYDKNPVGTSSLRMALRLNGLEFVEPPKKRSKEEIEFQKKMVELWDYPIGTWVKVKLHEGSDQKSRTTSKAFLSRGEMAAVFVMGMRGSCALERVRVFLAERERWMGWIRNLEMRWRSSMRRFIMLT